MTGSIDDDRLLRDSLERAADRCAEDMRDRIRSYLATTDDELRSAQFRAARPGGVQHRGTLDWRGLNRKPAVWRDGLDFFRCLLVAIPLALLGWVLMVLAMVL